MIYKKPHLFVIAGPNGAGKTTSAMKLLPDFLQCEEYVNADGIASGLSQFRPESVAINAGRTMLSRIKELVRLRKSFAFETTLASRSFVNFLSTCNRFGYSTNIIFLWLQSPELAIRRIVIRVKNGGHSIPEETIIRRYKKGIENFFKLYMPVITNWTIYDNSYAKPVLIAKKFSGKNIEVINKSVWWKIQEISK